MGSGVTCAVFTTMGLGAARAEVLAHAFSPAFFIGTRNGSVFYCDDLGHSTEVQGLGARASSPRDAPNSSSSKSSKECGFACYLVVPTRI